ncbi:cysteine proteinase [Athelia psychrophila]|uniref:Cysteine proteinase n=1 Tax=Athelia psychrophila TaxID=1759441 RepID=A0A166R5C3_9AGAM|nr:cysteine proteinase [Fibularhizoctonia sp. CBS 109695]
MAPARRPTRAHKPPLLSDPEKNNQLLAEQLRSLGLYAAPTLGDGNCLFRALADQLYGTPSHHHQLRADICDWIETHKQRYEPFCEDERGLGSHLSCMREQATYGGHLELSAFAHLTRRNVKVIQPGLVYVIEWAAGGSDASGPVAGSTSTEDDSLNERERRRLRRDEKRAEKRMQMEDNDDDSDDPADPAAGAVYVAYHDWEHFSSIRNLKGPHSGMPFVVEAPADEAPSPIKPKSKPSRAKPKAEPKIASKRPTRSKLVTSASLLEPPQPATPSQIPLPASRSPSLSPSQSASVSSPALPDPVFRADVSPPTPHPNQAPTLPSPLSAIPSGHSLINLRVHRSPKRSFDESSGSSASSESAAKRTRAADADELESTPGLSAPGSSAGSVSSSLSSPESSPLLSTPPVSAAAPAEKAKEKTKEKTKELTRRQRKALGLPKEKVVLVAKRTGTSAGKIKIPGGKYNSHKKAVSTTHKPEVDDEGGEGEWRTNGTGRVDVRGFRELKI